MARISLHIEADDADDLRRALAGILNNQNSAMPRDDEEAEDPNRATQDAEPGERQRRPRRTKAQIEADAQAAAEGNTSSGSATDASSGSAEATPGRRASSTQSVDGQAEDPFASPPTSSASQVSASKPTLQDMRNALATHMKAEGKDGGTAREALKKFKSNDPASAGQPAVRVSELHPDDYAAAIEALAV